jgi:4-amino-4-deoxy-L-arabinose transferase-like glycosyltransferase
MVPTPLDQGKPSGASRWVDAGLVLVLLLLAFALHAWVFSHTAMASRDSIGYIRYALMLEQMPWLEALPKIEQHPLYPATLLAVSVPVRQALGFTPQAMVISAQLTSTVAGILLVVPMFFLGRELFDRRVGFWAALLFLCLPVAAHVTCDALSDSLFLLLTTTALLFAAQGLRLQSSVQFILAGLFGGLSYLARPEGMLIVAFTFVVLLAVQLLPARRWAWQQAVACGVALAVSAVLIGGPYMAAIGGVTVKPTGRKMLGTLERDDTLPPPSASVSSGPTVAMTLAWWLQPGETNGRPTAAWALHALIFETYRTFEYVFWAPALFGIWLFRDRVRQTPGLWLLLLVAGGVWLVLWRMALVVGYVSERHLLLPVLCFSFPAVACLIWCGERLPGWLGRMAPSPRWQPALLIAWLTLATSWGLPAAIKPLHENRLGHKEAGLWLANHAQPNAVVIDPFCWAHYYAGKVFQEGKSADTEPGMRYVVLEIGSNPHSRLPSLPSARKLAEQGQIVYEWQPSKRQLKEKAEPVAVYAVPPEIVIEQ